MHQKSCRDLDRGASAWMSLVKWVITVLSTTPGHQIRVWCVNFEKIQKNIFIRHECNAASVLTRRNVIPQKRETASRDRIREAVDIGL